MPPQSTGTDPVAGLVEVKRFSELERDLIPCLERLDRVRKRHQRMVVELEMNVVLIAEVFHPMDPGERSGAADRGDPDMLGPQSHGSRLRRHRIAAQKLGGNEVDGGGAKPAGHIRRIWALV